MKHEHDGCDQHDVSEHLDAEDEVADVAADLVSEPQQAQATWVEFPAALEDWGIWLVLVVCEAPYTRFLATSSKGLFLSRGEDPR